MYLSVDFKQISEPSHLAIITQNQEKIWIWIAEIAKTAAFNCIKPKKTANTLNNLLKTNFQNSNLSHT